MRVRVRTSDSRTHSHDMKCGIRNSVSWSVRQQVFPCYWLLMMHGEGRAGGGEGGCTLTSYRQWVVPRGAALRGLLCESRWWIGPDTWPSMIEISSFRWVHYKNWVVGFRYRGDETLFVCYRIILVILKLDGTIQNDWMRINRGEGGDKIFLWNVRAAVF
jgi:hypothetical protein